MRDRIAIIVLTYNGLQDTRECLRSLQKLQGAPATIYVVDNGSRDGTADAIASEFGDFVIIIRNEKNLLFAGGNNVGIRRALGDAHEFILLLNNDTTVAPDFLLHLARASEEIPNAILVPKIYFASRPDILWYAGGLGNLRRARFMHRGIREKDRGQYDKVEATDWATGCALFVPRSVFEKVGLLDEDLGLYNEDVDFCLRARASGFGIYYVPSAKVWHKISATMGGNLSRAKLVRKWRSLRVLLRKHLPNPWARTRALLDFCITEPVRVASLVIRGKLKT
ncbi:MAG: glycosyltransferase family 2 protein [bacterium]